MFSDLYAKLDFKNGLRPRTYALALVGVVTVLGAGCSDDAALSSSSGGTDADAGADTGTIMQNKAPTGKDQSVTTTQEAPLKIGLQGSDPENDALTFATVTAPANGSLAELDAKTGMVTYTPKAGYTGDDSFTFTVSDGKNTSGAAKVIITVSKADLAVAQAQAATTNEDTAKEITLVATGGVAPVAYSISTQPTHGTLGTVAGGKVTYTPAKDYNGADAFAFKAKGVGAAETTANVSLTVTAVNDAPVVTEKTVTGFAGVAQLITVAATDVDSAGPFTFAANTAVNGTLGTVAGNAVTFTPTAAGTASFMVTANDGTTTGAASKITVTVKDVAKDCNELLAAGATTSGVYPIDPDGAAATYPAISVYCDQTNNGGGWTRVVNHNTTASGFFASKVDAALKNANDPNSTLYSILSYLDGFKGNGGYEFRINWPLAPTVYNIWQQSSSPMVAGRVTGYRGVRIDAASRHWGGLELSTQANSLLDGSVTHVDWWYAIGSIANYGSGLPAATEIGGNETTTQVQLWVRAIPTCGNGIKESNEMCDDGNATNGDGCSSTCAVERTAYKTCREILAATQSLGDGSYVIDVDGNGGQDPFAVYCDMTSNGGGWTLVGKVGQGDFTNLTNPQYVDLVLNPTNDVNVGQLMDGTTPAVSQMAFFNKAHTDALFAASGKTVRADMSQNIQTPAADGTYFQRKTTNPNGWSLWAGLRDSRLWNDNGAVAGSDVSSFGTQFVLNKGTANYTPGTDAVVHGGDGSFGFWSTYTHTLNDATTFTVSRHGGLLCDGYAGYGWLWLLTLDAGDGRWKADTASYTRTRIWVR